MKNNSEVMEIVTEKLIKITENIETEIPINQYKRILMCINDEIMKQAEDKGKGENKKKASRNQRKELLINDIERKQCNRGQVET